MSDAPHGFLETGHETTTPIGDTYLRRFLTNWIETNEAMARSLGGATIRARGFWASDTGRPSTYANTATLIRPLPPDPTPVMAELEGFFSARDAGESRETYIFSPWPTPDLRSFGWALGGHPPLHLLPAGRCRPPLPDGFRIEPVMTPEMLATLEQIAIDGYPFPEVANAGTGALFGAGLLAEPRFRFWLGFDGERPVGMAIAVVDHGINHVMLIATLPDARRRGFGAALAWQASLADPALPAMLLSSDLGRPVYDRMGYLPLFRFTTWYRSREPRLTAGRV